MERTTMVRLHLSNISRTHWCNLITSLVKDNKLTLKDKKCLSFVTDFLADHADYNIGLNFEADVDYLNPRAVLNLVTDAPAVWQNGELKNSVSIADHDDYYLYNLVHNNRLFLSDDFEQWSEKVWQLVDTTIRYFGDKQNWNIEEDLYYMLKNLGLADNIIYDLDDDED